MPRQKIKKRKVIIRTKIGTYFSRDCQQSYDDGVLHLFFPSEMMAPILQFLSQTVPTIDGAESLAAINFEYKSEATNVGKREVENSKISLVNLRYCPAKTIRAPW